ncbi:MAG: hypothetical protein L6W00_09155 [Lentisphaeria bacterium]|nr:MAG: hypothetical protein L6W00_09155 [Lentisphaeria bacterium]
MNSSKPAARRETTAVKLKSTEQRLAAAEQKLRSDVLDRYHEAAVRLDLALTEERLLLNQHGGGVYYLPLVKIGGKNVLVASFHTLAGDLETPLKFDRILELAYRTRPGDAPDAAAPGITAAGPLLTLPDEPRIAALEIAPEGRKPLETMTIGRLRQRGLHNLYLSRPPHSARSPRRSVDAAPSISPPGSPICISATPDVAPAAANCARNRAISC